MSTGLAPTKKGGIWPLHLDEGLVALLVMAEALQIAMHASNMGDYLFNELTAKEMFPSFREVTFYVLGQFGVN